MTERKAIVVPPDGGNRHTATFAPGRSSNLKLLSHQTGESVTLFEETLPAGTKSLFHRHPDSDEVAWVLEGEFTFRIGSEVSSGGPGTCVFFPRQLPHAWKNSGTTTGRVVFFYTPAAAGRYVEKIWGEDGASLSDADRVRLREEFNWEILGPNPL